MIMFKQLAQTCFVAVIAIWLSSCSSSPPRAPEISERIQDRGDSVFKIVFLAEDPQAEIDPVRFDYLLEEAEKGDFLDFLYAERVKECRKQKTKNCRVYFSGFASAFLANNKRTIYTVRHAFDPWLEEWKGKRKGSPSLEELLASAPKILLYDKFKNLIFDSRKKGDSVRFLFVGDPPHMEDFVFNEFKNASPKEDLRDPNAWAGATRAGVIGKLTDLAKLELSREIDANPLSFAAQAPKLGEPLFLLGYPSRSARQAIHSSHYYDGHSFKVSSGRASTAYKMYRRIFEQYQEKEVSESKVFHLFEKYFYYHDAPSAEGFSGGPILNEAGEVVTLQSSGSEEGGFGLQPDWIRQLFTRYEVAPPAAAGAANAPVKN